MKYKRIKGMLHNLGSGFSYDLHTNAHYIPPGLDEIEEIIVKDVHKEVYFDFLNKIAFPGIHSDPVMKVYQYYVDDLPRLVKDHKLELNKLQNVVFKIYKIDERILYKAQALDDREVLHEYLINVKEINTKKKA